MIAKFWLFGVVLLWIGGSIGSPGTTQQKRSAPCIPEGGGNSKKDDTPAIQAAITSCGKGGTILIPQGKTYHLLTVLEFTGCEGCTMQIDGTLQASNDLAYWQGKRAIIHMSEIKKARVFRSTGSGTIDGNGLAAWERFLKDKEYFGLTLNYIDKGSSDITIMNLKLINPPNVFFSVSGGSTRVTYDRLTMSASNDKGVQIKNTDGFNPEDVRDVKVLNTWVSNQDDCIAFKSGVDVSNITCIGSDGLSVGSLGRGKGAKDLVKNVYITNAQMIKSTKATGIKVWPGGSSHGTAVVSNITWDGVKVSDCDYAAQIQACYGEKEAYCTKNPSTATISNVLFKSFSGSTNGKFAPNVANLNCPPAGCCQIQFKEFNIKPSRGEKAKVVCANVKSGNPGVECSKGVSG